MLSKHTPISTQGANVNDKISAYKTPRNKTDHEAGFTRRKFYGIPWCFHEKEAQRHTLLEFWEPVNIPLLPPMVVVVSG